MPRNSVDRLFTATALATLLLCSCCVHVTQSQDAGVEQTQQQQQIASRVFRELTPLASDSSSDDGANAITMEKQQDNNDITAGSDDTDTSEGISSTSIIVIAVGVVTLAGLVLLLVTLRRNRSHQEESGSDPPANSISEPPRTRPKRKTFAVPRVNSGLGDIDDSNRSNVPVLGDGASERKMRDGPRLAPQRSWGEDSNASFATSSYSVAPFSSRHARPAVPVRIYAPARGRGPGDNQTTSEYSLNADDYSIGMLESPISTEYSFGSEGDDVFPSSQWDDVDSYRRLNFTCLSTSSSNVFDSNPDRSGGDWKQVCRPSGAPSIDSSLQPVTPGVLFVRNIDQRSMGRMRLDPRGRGTSRMRLDVEV
ncbi:hypothetical protein BBJ28_00018523 [Nothophytophthora sp. Chile5]|nr:hypothetical protein BBJ28_00018523 [Nothophytophthora sp. Chile5]